MPYGPSQSSGTYPFLYPSWNRIPLEGPPKRVPLFSETPPPPPPIIGSLSISNPGAITLRPDPGNCCWVAQWYPLPFFCVLGFLVKYPTKKRYPYYEMSTGLLRLSLRQLHLSGEEPGTGGKNGGAEMSQLGALKQSGHVEVWVCDSSVCPLKPETLNSTPPKKGFGEEAGVKRAQEYTSGPAPRILWSLTSFKGF